MNNWMKRDPILTEKIELGIDLDKPGKVWVDRKCIHKIRELLKQIIDEIVKQTTAEEAEEESKEEDDKQTAIESRWAATSAEHNLKTLKKLVKNTTRNRFTELWDEENENYTHDRKRQGELAKAAAIERQGKLRAKPEAGKEFLEKWTANFSACRSRPDIDEVERIINETRTGIRPGPDGIPSIAIKQQCQVLAPIFLEAWDEFTAGEKKTEAHMTHRTWILAPKIDNAKTLDKLRDIELPNEIRKVFERMLALLLDEVCQTQLSKAQQGFISGREITKNTIKMLHAFATAKEEAEKHPAFEKLSLFLLADCSKGFNNSDPKWLEACLEAAKTPPDILNVVDALSLNEPILSLDGIEFDPVKLISGLCQGGPASGILFEISVDAKLMTLEQLEGVLKVVHRPGRRNSRRESGSDRRSDS